MLLTAFRIRNFRSIADTRKCLVSGDGVTVLIGQNESGKSSILEGLNAFWTKEILRLDTRTGDPFPSVECTFKFEPSDVAAFLASVEPALHIFFGWVARGLEATIRVDWDDGQVPRFLLSLADSEISETLAGMRTPKVPTHEMDKNSELESSSTAADVASRPPDVPTDEEFAKFVYDQAPPFVLFADGAQMLPNQIDIPLPAESKNGGVAAARNFLRIAEIDVEKIATLDDREAGTLLKRASVHITQDFQEYWAQQIGKSAKIGLQCELKRKDVSDSPPGAPYLVFWISEGAENLYPEQRSKGVRWFLSFYLLVTATKLTSDRRIFLLDEPGANLHSRAQKDVLKLLENMRTSSQIIYSTHSADLVELKHLYRILAVQRATEDDVSSPTTVKRGHELYTASPDTLAPLHAAMGMDIANQQVVKRTNNVLLEESSGFFFFQAFRQLCGKTEECHLIPGGGATNILPTAYLLFGWGVDFGVLVDDEPTGRTVIKKLRDNLYPSDSATAQTRFRKLPGFDGIEDVFTPGDYKRYVLLDASAQVTGKNSAHAKKNGASKPLLASQMLIEVNAGRLTMEAFEPQTQANIKIVADQLSDILATLPKSAIAPEQDI